MNIVEKIKHAYYMRRAAKGEGVEAIIKRRNKDEISRLFKKLPYASRETASRILISECLDCTPKEADWLFRRVNDALRSYGSEDELVQRMHLYPNCFHFSEIEFKGDKVITAFLETATGSCLHGAQKIILSRSDAEIRDFYRKFSYGYINEPLAAWALASGDPAIINKLFRRDIYLSREVLEMIFASGNKQNILLLAKRRLSSVGIDNILSGKYNISWSEDERQFLKNRADSLREQEKVWAEIAADFDCIR